MQAKRIFAKSEFFASMVCEKCLVLTLAQNFVVVCLCDADKLAVIFDGFHDPLVVELLHGGGDTEAVAEAEGGRNIVCGGPGMLTTQLFQILSIKTCF